MEGRIPYYYTSPAGNSVPNSSSQIPPPPPPPPPRPSVQGSSFSSGFNHVYGYQTYQPTLAEQSHSQNKPAKAPVDAPIEQKESQWFCDACDLKFDSERAFKSHRKSHVKCSDCSFEGAPKNVKAHYQASHGKFSGSGFKTVAVAVPGCRVQRFKICVGNRPEDIKRWVADRKRRFPRVAPMPDESTGTAKTAETKESQSSMTSLLAGYGSSGSEEEIDQELSKNPTTPIKPSCPKIEQSEGKQHTVTETLIPKRGTRPCRYFMRNGSCLNGDACRFSHELPQRNQNESRNRKRKRGGHTTSDTLLRRLLTNDMERESTLTMQLLKFIVNKKCFGADEPTTKE